MFRLISFGRRQNRSHYFTLLVGLCVIGFAQNQLIGWWSRPSSMQLSQGRELFEPFPGTCQGAAFEIEVIQKLLPIDGQAGLRPWGDRILTTLSWPNLPRPGR